MIFEYKLKQPQTLFNVWEKKSRTNQNPAARSLPAPKSIEIETVSTEKINNTNTSSTPSFSCSNNPVKRNTVN